MGLGTSPSMIDFIVWKYGGRLDLWIKNIDAIADLTTRLKLKPVAREHLSNMEPMAAETERSVSALRRLDIRGGIRMPHLHFKGEIFLLNDEQWKAFAGQTLKSFQERLGAAKVVNFDGMAELSEAIYAHT